MIPDPDALIESLLIVEAAQMNPEHTPVALQQAQETLASLAVAVAQMQDRLVFRGRPGLGTRGVSSCELPRPPSRRRAQARSRPGAGAVTATA